MISCKSATLLILKKEAVNPYQAIPRNLLSIFLYATVAGYLRSNLHSFQGV